jgi:cytochrome c-type biogenesis protein CcmH/NrfF
MSVGAEPRTSLTDIEDEVMCPICGTALNLSQAPQAERERELIRRLIAEGHTKQEIKDELVRQYGSEVLAVPGGSGFDLAAWLVPAAGIALAALALALAVRRWRARGRGAIPGEAAPLNEADAKRVESDLARYD